MIIEPTGWGVECDQCGQEFWPESARDEVTLRAEAKGDGWIFVACYEFCSLDCLLTRRHVRMARDSMAAITRMHITSHTDRCCALHRTHATRGRHSWDGQCVDPNRAGVAVL